MCFVLFEAPENNQVAKRRWQLLAANLKRETQLSCDLLWASAAPPPVVSLPRVTVHCLPPTWPDADSDGQYAPIWAYRRLPWLGDSLAVCLALKALERSQGPYEFIEFPDEHGLALAALAEKKLGLAFQETILAVRICGETPVEYDTSQLLLLAGFDQERKALEDAEHVIVPSLQVWESYLSHYAFSVPPRPHLESSSPRRSAAKPARAPKVSPPSRRSPGEVTVIIPHYRLSKYLPAAIDSVLASVDIKPKIIVIDDASPEEEHQRVLAELEERYAKHGLTVVRNELNRGLGATRNRGSALATTEYVLFLDADDLIAPTFLHRATTALDLHAEFDLVVPACGVFRDLKRAFNGHFVDYTVFLGNAPTVGWLENHFSSATCLMRRSIFEQFRYEEELPAFEDWALYLTLAARGHRFLVTNQIQFWYRRLDGSMLHSLSAAQRRRIRAEMQLRVGRTADVRAPLEAMLCAASEPPLRDQLVLRYRLAELICGPFDRMPIVRRAAANFVVSMGIHPEEGRLLRHTVVDRLNLKLKRNPRFHAVMKRFFGRAESS